MQQGYRNIIKYMLGIFFFVSILGYFNMDVHAKTSLGYFVEAEEVIWYNNDSSSKYSGHYGTTNTILYKNTAIDNSKYIVYSNAVNYNGSLYDLVIYPFKGTTNAGFLTSTTKSGKKPGFWINTDNAYAKYKIVITQHGNRNNTINMNCIMGIGDLDKSEYFGFPSSFQVTHVGTNLKASNKGPGPIEYIGTKASNTNEELYNKSCVIGTINIPTSGIEVYYGGTIDSTFATLINFDEILDYWGDDVFPDPKYEYKISFNANGGSGTPSTIIAEGTDSSVIMGDISSTIPTRSGYIFKGWSASSSWNSKRIAYSSSYGGETAKDGTSATTTSSSWSFSDYCNYTGGSTSSRTLTLYAQWERDVNEYKIQFNANGGSGSVPSTITKEGTDTSVVMGDISSTVPTRSGYIFKGWSASSSWNSKRIAYSSSSGGSAASDGTSATTTSSSWSYATYCEKTGGSTSNNTLTLYAMWRTAYTHTLAYNANGGSGTPSSSTVTNDSATASLTVSSTVPTRTGYTFTGWNTNASGTGTDYSAGGSVSVGANATVTLYAQWRLNNYDVTYIDVNNDSGEELNRQVIQKPYNSTVKGIDIGSSTADNAYYNNYALISGADGYTTSVVNENGTTVVYRYFKWLTTDINGTVSWNDNSNKYQTRPDTVTVRLYRDGVEIDSVTVNTGSNVNTYSFADLLKYDPETGRAYVYTVTQDEVLSQASLEGLEDKYTTEQNKYDFKNTIRNIEKPGPNPPPGDKGFHVSGNIYWNDKDDKLGFRPSEVTITLYQKGEDGEWKPFREPVIVDSKNENHYLFDWLPKYWYDASGTPNTFEYKVEESFSAWYVKDGEMVDAYTITPDNPNEFDFTNTLYIVNPDIPFSEYTNTLVIKTNTEEGVRVILKPQKPIYGEDLNVTYGDYSGNDVTVFTDNVGTVVDKLSPTRYEIVIDSTEYTLDDIKLSLPQNVELENIGGKWYVTIGNQPEDAFGTIEIELSKKNKFYQETQRINNYFAWTNKINNIIQNITKKMSGFIAKQEEPEIPEVPLIPGVVREPVTVTYMDADTLDNNLYSKGDRAKILDYLGIIPEDMIFIGWATTDNATEIEYSNGDIITVGNENIVLYPVFEIKAHDIETVIAAEQDNSEQLEEPVITETVD